MPASEASASSAPSAIREGARTQVPRTPSRSRRATRDGDRADDSVSNIGRPCVLKAAKAAKARSLNQNVIVSLRDTRWGAQRPCRRRRPTSTARRASRRLRARRPRARRHVQLRRRRQQPEFHSKADLRRARIHAVIIYATGEMVAPRPTRCWARACRRARGGPRGVGVGLQQQGGRGGGLVFKSKEGRRRQAERQRERRRRDACCRRRRRRKRVRR